jgi:hypothetical protein
MLTLLLVGLDVFPMEKHILFCAFVFVSTGFIGYQEQQRFLRKK